MESVPFFDNMLGESSSAPAASRSGQAPQQPAIPGPAVDPLQGLPRWHFEPLPQSPRELHDNQLDFLSGMMREEVADHNKARSHMQRFLDLSLKHERDLLREQGNVRYLNYIVGDLRWQLQNEKVKRVMAEQEKLQLGKNPRCEIHASIHHSLGLIIVADRVEVHTAGLPNVYRVTGSAITRCP